MTQAERRHDRLAVRLSLIISRLVAGETLSVRKLAAEFGVSVRTLRRDFRERLMYLDLEYQSGYCRLRTAGSETQMVPDVLIFAHRSGMAGLFPGFDRRLVNALLMCDESPCVIAPANPVPSPSGALSFWRLIQAITRAFDRAVKRARERYEKTNSLCDESFLKDLRFHDLRHEATSRLAEIFPMHELTKITGHKDPRMLMRYYHPKAEDLALKLK
ncbi:tyrosine-type recombinase/integrase [Escherichia coli]|nr:tyrosine-type recombinase/integrase [Escherichia coli]HAV9244177.1 tyrosine-type recombinase/integrase [Escherichia coli]HAW0883236.1 tyrosine-type recombinase/integrase [Escherichia coli]